jgi:hypothetical protein
MLELAIDLEGFTVGEGQDLHHDDARDPHYRVDPVIDSSTIHGMTELAAYALLLAGLRAA